jgi:multiple sugar transport system permease protein
MALGQASALPLALLNMEYGSVGQVNFGFLEAGAVIAMIPCLVLYVALQRYYIRGLTSAWSRAS